MNNKKYPIKQSNDYASVTEDLIRMPDGVGIYTRLSVPKGKDKYPIVFDRTPYAEALNGVPYDITRLYSNIFIKHGYAIVTQHCRGTADSEGEMHPYEYEKADGLATLEYIRTLPFYNGEIYVIGKSYLASTHLLYLSEKPHDIKGACIQIQTDRMYYAKYCNGCCKTSIQWYAERLKRRFPNQNPETNERPYIDVAKRTFGVDMPMCRNNLIHNTFDEYWKNDPRHNVIDTLEIPTLLVEGWYDFYIYGMTDMWSRMPDETKKKSAMIIGPYGHSTSVTSGAEYPFPNGNIPDTYGVDWFDSIRNHTKYEHAEFGKVTYYSICADKWKTAIYPPKNPSVKKLYFSKDKALSSSPKEDESVSYVYDPETTENPHKFYNIFKSFAPNSFDGIISYVSEPAKIEESFYGKVKFNVNVSSDCEDTAFMFRLYFVENGESYNLTESVFAISHFVPNYKPGEIVEISLETPPIAFTLKKGVSLRVDLSSSMGPYAPHANLRGHFAYITETRVANNTFHTKGSYIELPYEE